MPPKTRRAVARAIDALSREQPVTIELEDSKPWRPCKSMSRLLHRISRVISRHGCDVDLVLISTEGEKAIDVFHITHKGAKLSDAAQRELTADLQRMLEETDEVN